MAKISKGQQTPKKSSAKSVGNKVVKTSIAMGEGQSKSKAGKVLKQMPAQTAGKKKGK